MVSQAEILERLGERFTLTPVPASGAAPRPSCSSSTADPQTVGVIASVSAPFCGSCDRVRLTADGQLRNCLFARREVDLRGPLRAGATDEELADLVIAEMWARSPGTASTGPASSSRTARCQRSVAEGSSGSAHVGLVRPHG